MRNSLIICLVFGALFVGEIKAIKNESVTRHEGEFTITTKDISVNIKPYVSLYTNISLTHAVKSGGKYYCYFNEKWKSFEHSDVKHFFILSKDGKIEKNIDLPNSLHDTIYTKPYMREESYYLDLKTFRWIATKAVDDVIYEDERFYVTYINLGEWGSITWFKDKLSGKEYECASSGTIVNKVESGYYITSNKKVLQIKDPLKMQECSADSYYETIKKKDFSYGSSSTIGTKCIYYDSTNSYKDLKAPKPRIETSFRLGNKLYYLCVDNVKTYIAKLENKKLIPLYRIGESYSLFDWSESYRCKIQMDNSQLLKFYAKKRNVYGFIELNGTQINIRQLKLIK